MRGSLAHCTDLAHTFSSSISTIFLERLHTDTRFSSRDYTIRVVEGGRLVRINENCVIFGITTVAYFGGVLRAQDWSIFILFETTCMRADEGV